MKRIGKNILILVIAIAKLVIIQGTVHAQIDLENYKKHESKIFEITDLERIQSHYIGNDGLYSHDLFLRKNGLYPNNKKESLIPYFSISFAKNEIISIKGGSKPVKNADPISLDFFVENRKSYNSVNVSTPIWDGRVYQDKNEIIV